MRLEINSATDFLVDLLRMHQGQLSEIQLQLFKYSVRDILWRRYTDHWFPDKPIRGSAYRCLRINGKMDPIIIEAGINVGLGPTMLRDLFPTELTMWIDPAEVSYRIGENGSICVLFERRNSPPTVGGMDELSPTASGDDELSPTASGDDESPEVPSGNELSQEPEITLQRLRREADFLRSLPPPSHRCGGRRNSSPTYVQIRFDPDRPRTYRDANPLILTETIRS